MSLFNKIDDAFLSKLASAKWQERGDTLEQIAKYVETPVLPAGNYGPLIRTLIQVVESDKHRQLLLRAVGILQHLAQGLRKNFTPHADRALSVFLTRCKENNPKVLQSLRSASLAVVDLMPLESVLTIIMNGLVNPSPTIQSASAEILTHALVTRCSPLTDIESVAPAQRVRHIKPLCAPLQHLSEHRTPECRDASFRALAALRLFLDSNPGQFALLTEGNLDEQRTLKVDLAYDVLKAELENRIAKSQVQRYSSKKVPASRAGKRKTRQDSFSPSINETPLPTPKLAIPGRKPLSEKQQCPERPTPIRLESKQQQKPEKVTRHKQRREHNPPGADDYQTLEQARDGLADYFTNIPLERLTDANWKSRLAATESVKTKVDSDPPSGRTAISLIYFFVHSNRLNDINQQVRNLSLQVVSHVIKRLRQLCETFSHRLFQLVCEATIPNLNKSRQLAQEVLNSMLKITPPDAALTQLIPIVFGLTVPAVLAASLEWMASVVTEVQFNMDDLVGLIRHGLASPNPGVRNAAIHLAGKFYVSLGHRGSQLRTLLSNEKPALLARLQGEFDRCETEADDWVTGSASSRRTESLPSNSKKTAVNTTFAAVPLPDPQTNIRGIVSPLSTDDDDSVAGTPIRGVINAVSRLGQSAPTTALFSVDPEHMDQLLELKQARLNNLNKMTCIDLGRLQTSLMETHANPQLLHCMFAPEVDSRLEALDRLIASLDTAAQDVSALRLTYAHFDMLLAWTIGACFAFGSSCEVESAFGTPVLSDLEVLITRGLHYITAAIVRFAQSNFKLSNQEVSLLLHALLSEQSPSLRCSRLHRSIESQLQNAISDLIRLLRQVHPASLLMDHLTALLHKCGSASERLNCLQELTSLVPRYGDVKKSGVNLGFTSKLVAQQIANSNPAVRNAALDFLLLVHRLLGNQLWEQIGPLQPNDRKLLEEHLKVQISDFEQNPPGRSMAQTDPTLSATVVTPFDSSRRTSSHRIASPPPAHVSPAAIGVLVPLLQDRDAAGTSEMAKASASEKLECALKGLISQLELSDQPEPAETAESGDAVTQDDNRILSSVILGALVDLEMIITDHRTCDLLIPYMNPIVRRLAVLLRTLSRTTCNSAMHTVFTNSLAGELAVLFKQPFLTREVNTDSLVHLLAGLFQLAESFQLDHDKPRYCNPRRAVLLRLVYFILTVIDPTIAFSTLLRLLSMCCYQFDCCRTAPSTGSRRMSTRRSSSGEYAESELLIKDLSFWPGIWRLVVAQLWQRIDSLKDNASQLNHETLIPLLDRVFTSIMDSSSDKAETKTTRRKPQAPASGVSPLVDRCVLHLLVTLYAYCGPNLLELVNKSHRKTHGRLSTFLTELSELMPNAPYSPNVCEVVRQVLKFPDVRTTPQQNNAQ